MGKIKNNQQGYSGIEALLIIIIIGMVGGIGWYVYHSLQNTNHAYGSATTTSNNASPKFSKSTKTSASSSAKTYIDPAGFTLSYPNDWQFIAKGTRVGDTEYAFNEFVSKANYQANNNAFILTFSTDTTIVTASQYSKDVFANRTDSVVSSTSSKINGYDTQTVNYKLPGGLPDGYDVSIVNNGKVVEFTYSQSSAEKSYIYTYKAIVSSIKFQN